MPGLSFDKDKDAKAIAIVRGGDKDGDILYLHEGTKKTERVTDEIQSSKYQKELKAYKGKERISIINRLQEALKKGLASDDLVGEDDATKKLYDKTGRK